MRCIRRLSLSLSSPQTRGYTAAAAPASTIHHNTSPRRCLGTDVLDGARDFDLEEHSGHGEQPLSVEDRPRYDWRTRSPSKRRPGGLIDSPLDGSKVNYPRRYRLNMQPLSPGDPWYFEIENYKFRFLDLLKAEEETELALIRARLANWPQEKLKRDGYCLTGLSAFWLQSNQFGKPVAAFLLGAGIALPYHRFENGTQILLSRLDPLHASLGQGSIIGSSETELRVSFNEKLDLTEDTWRLDLFNTDIAYQRMRAAVDHLCFDPGEQERASTERAQITLQGTHLRDVLLSSFSPSSDMLKSTPLERRGMFVQDQFILSWAHRYAVKGEPVVVEGDPDLSCLNSTQRRAVAMMLGERVSLVQGPPGTGKTKTIIEAVKLLKVHFQVPQPLLVCTYTNVAVDNLVEGLAAAGVRPLRVGSSAKVQPELLEHTLDAQIEKHVLKRVADKLRGDIDRLDEGMTNVREKLKKLAPLSARTMTLERTLERMKTDWEGKKRRLWAVQSEMVQDIVNRADVVCTTCIAAASSSLRVTDFPVVFLDEASMSTEPASLIPLMKGCQHLALIGDHKQLPPVITSPQAIAGGLGVSLFERLTAEGVVPSIMLDMQYRMHPSLARFPSSEFYNFSLHDGTVASALQPPASRHLEVNPNTGHRPSVIFLDHAGSEEMKDRSRVNYNEARIVCAVIEDLLLSNPTMKGEDIGVIAPYAAQISLLQRLLKSSKEYRQQLERLLGPLRVMQVGHIEVKTVDGFEGREKEVIIFSTVRNNAAGHIGFLADRRRMNVGLTRAKRGLFVVGSVGTLQTGKVGRGVTGIAEGEGQVWRRYVEWLAVNGAVRRLEGREGGMKV